METLDIGDAIWQIRTGMAAQWRLMWLSCEDELRALAETVDCAHDQGITVFRWSVYGGLRRVRTEKEITAVISGMTDDLKDPSKSKGIKEKFGKIRRKDPRICEDAPVPDSVDPGVALDFALNWTGVTRGGGIDQAFLPEIGNARTLFVFHELDEFIQHDPVLRRKLFEISRELQASGKVVMIMTPRQDPPHTSIDVISTRIELAPPPASWFGETLKKYRATSGPERFTLDDAGIERAAAAAAGLSRQAFIQVLLTAQSVYDVFDERVIKLIAAEKRKMIEGTGYLQYEEPGVSLGDMGGQDLLKTWIKQRMLAFTPEAKAYGLHEPKGVLCVGPPGVGKSLAARAAAAEWGRPLIRLDVGAIFGGIVGQSEANMRRVIQLLTALSPCVVGDTLIRLASGSLVTAEELWLEGRQVDLAAIDAEGNATRNRLRAIIKKSGNTVEVHTTGGRIRGREDHRVLTRRGWVALGECRVGDKIMFRESNKFDRQEISGDDFVPDGARVLDGKLRLGGGGFRDAVIGGVPAVITPEIGLILGSIDSDGTWSDQCAFYRTSIEENALFFAKTINRLFGVDVIPNKRENAIQIDGYDCGSVYQIRIPKLAMLWLKAVRACLFQDRFSWLLPSYLHGFIQGVGCVSGDKISITQNAGRKRQEILEVLRRLGIYVRDTERKNIDISGGARIGDLINQIVTGSVRFPTDKIFDASMAQKRWTFTRGVEFTDAGVFCEVRKVVHRGEETVYDLACEAPHNYISNGMVSHNCVVWIDEIEKGFAGSASSGSTDGGTTSRVFQSLLTWLNEKTEPVFVVATANHPEILPAELLRKGRFDDIFALDLPPEHERADIFAIHVRKHKRDPSTFDLSALARASSEFSGAEIAQAVVDAMFSAYAAGSELKTEHIMASLKATVPLAKTMREQIDQMRAWAQSRARPASAAPVVEIEEFSGNLQQTTANQIIDLE